MLEIALDKPEYRPGDTMTVAVTARNAGTPHAQCGRRPAARDADRRRQGRRGAGEDAGRQRLGHRRLSRRDLAPAARRAGAAHAGPRHRRAMVLRSIARRKTLDVELKRAGAAAAEFDACTCRSRFAGLRAGEEARDRRRRGRCRHSQPDQLQAAVAGRLLSRPARALGRDPRSLRPTDRRHAGHARPDPQRRRRGRRSCRAVRRPGRRSRFIPASSRSAPTAPPRWRSTFPTSPARVRVMAVAWSKDKIGHASADVDRARSGGAHRDAAALPAAGRPFDRASRSRQCRRRRPATTRSR